MATSLPGESIVDDPFAASRMNSVLADVSFSSDKTGVAVGSQVIYEGEDVHPLVLPLVISLRADGHWHYESTPSFPSDQGVDVNAISLVDPTHGLAVGNQGFILSYGYDSTATPAPVPTGVPIPPTPVTTPTPPVGPLPTERVANPNSPDVAYFAVVGHTIRGGFRDYWEKHGGLEQFGYPITEEFSEKSPTDGKEYVTQYFERARFEWHPENKPPYDVLLGLLGNEVTKGRENQQPFRPVPANPGKGGPLYFPPTGHTMAPQFTEYWQTHGGLPVYGYPISEPFVEVSMSDGKPYLVQYFERNRLEYHPELPEPYRVSLGLLGVQMLQARGWIAK